MPLPIRLMHKPSMSSEGRGVFDLSYYGEKGDWIYDVYLRPNLLHMEKLV